MRPLQQRSSVFCAERNLNPSLLVNLFSHGNKWKLQNKKFSLSVLSVMTQSFFCFLLFLSPVTRNLCARDNLGAFIHEGTDSTNPLIGEGEMPTIQKSLYNKMFIYIRFFFRNFTVSIFFIILVLEKKKYTTKIIILMIIKYDFITFLSVFNIF